jgi:hypothetical protein
MQSDEAIPEDSPMAWQKEVPYDTRQEAIADAITSYKGCLTKIKNGTLKHFNISFRSKKLQTSQAFRVNKNALDLQTMEIFKRRLKKKKKLRMRKRDREKVKQLFIDQQKPDGNFTILKTRPRHWYLCLPKEVKEGQAIKDAYNSPGPAYFSDLLLS